jgi:GNAT superfamily N-acetyltransferase
MAPMVRIRPIGPEDRVWVGSLIRERWGGPTVVAHGAVFHPEDLPGFVGEIEGAAAGLLTYHLDGTGCEVVTIDALLPGRGVGTGLIQAAADTARAMGSGRLWLITTNDNLDALGFYFRRGFRVAAVRVGAIDRARVLKPTIPAVGQYGIPIRDEIELELGLDG